jgi:hypothetical protein
MIFYWYKWFNPLSLIDTNDLTLIDTRSLAIPCRLHRRHLSRPLPPTVGGTTEVAEEVAQVALAEAVVVDATRHKVVGHDWIPLDDGPRRPSGPVSVPNAKCRYG